MNLKENDNYFAVSDMLLTVTMLSNNFNEELEKDTSLIVDFIGNAFNMNKKDIGECLKLITNDLTIISTNSDVDAYLINAGSLDEYKDIKEYLLLKSDAITKLRDISQLLRRSSYNESRFDYSHLKEYFPEIRFKELEKITSNGNVDVCRAVAIFIALGIGCNKDYEKAIYKLKQCAYWGDTISLYYLSYLYKLIKDKKNERLFSNLTKLKNYISSGRVNLPKEIEKDYDLETTRNLKIITLIYHEIVLDIGRTNINFPFVDVIFMNNLDYYKKIGCINTYANGYWKEILSSSSDPDKKMGFNI